MTVSFKLNQSQFMNSKNQNSFALITGASNGIGKSMAIELAKRGNNILLISRTESDLKIVANYLISNYKIQAYYLAIDLSLPASPQTIMNWIKEKNIPVHILVNNAGYGLWGNFDEIPLDKQLNMLHLNMLSVVSLTYKAIPLLKQQNHSFILNTSSMAGYSSVAKFALYAASKSFITVFSKSLRSELNSSNISLTCLSPGAVITKFTERAQMLEKHKKLALKFGMTPEIIAQKAITAMYNKKKEIIPGMSNRLMVGLMKILPENLITQITTKMYK